MILTLKYASVNYYPKIFGDEYGYWGAGAFFAGLKWNDITALNEYYGWGYGLILSFILRLPISSKSCYIFAIALNGIMLWGVYCLYYIIARDLFPDKGNLFRVVLSFFCAVLPSSLYYTQYTLSEIVLELFYSLLVYVLWLLLKEYRLKYAIIIAIIDCIMLSIHLRTIGVIAISVLVVIVISLRNIKKNYKCLAVFFAVTIIGLVVVLGVKRIYLDAISLHFVQSRTGNTASGQVRKIYALMTLAGIKSFSANLCGRLYSLLVNSYVLSLVAIVGGLIGFVKGIRKKSVDRISGLTVICVLNTLSLIAISSLFMIESETSRFDILTYTRYHEFATGMLIFLGVYYLRKYAEKRSFTVPVMVFSIFTLLLCKVVAMVMNFGSSTANAYAHNPRLLYFCKNVSNIRDTFVIMLILSVGVFILLYLFIKIPNNRFVIGTLICVIVFNAFESDYVFREGCLSWSQQSEIETDDMVSYIEFNDYQNKLYFLMDDSVLKVEQLRFALKEGEIQVTDEMNLDSIMENGNILVTSDSYTGRVNFDDYEIIFESNHLYLWRLKTE